GLAGLGQGGPQGAGALGRAAGAVAGDGVERVGGGIDDEFDGGGRRRRKQQRDDEDRGRDSGRVGAAGQRRGRLLGQAESLSGTMRGWAAAQAAGSTVVMIAA